MRAFRRRLRTAPHGRGARPCPLAREDRAPSRHALDGACRASARSLTRPRPAFGIGPDVALIGRRHLTAALSTTCEVDELPLTFPVAPRARSGFWPAASRVAPRTAPTPSSSKPDASSTQNAFHRRMPLEEVSPGCPEEIPESRWYVGFERPATGLAASPPRAGFRRLFASRCALAPRG